MLKSVLKDLAKDKDFYVIVSLYTLSIYIFYVARQYPTTPGVPRAQNPGFYPMLISGILFLLTTVYFFQTLKSKITRQNEEIKLNEEEEFEDLQQKSEVDFWGESSKKTRKYLFISIFMVFIFIYALNWFGFLITTFLFMFIITRMLSSEEDRTLKILILSVLVTIVLFILFDLFIGIRFPEGLLL